MKAIVTTLLAIALFAAPKATQASGNEGDTVVIELNNKSKIVIYTADKEALKDMEQYDINKMIQDLNSALGSKKIEKVELQDKDGNKYMKDTTLVFGDGEAKSRIKIGNLELLVDADDWDELEDEFDDDDIPVRRYDYEENKIDRTRHFFNVHFPLFVLCHTVNGYAHHLGIARNPFLSQLRHSAKLCCTNRREILGMRKQNLPACAKPFVKLDQAAAGLGAEIRCHIIESKGHIILLSCA